MNNSLNLRYDNPNVVDDIKKINEKIEKETDNEKLLKLRTQRLYRGMELNTNIYSRSYRSMYPY